MTTAPKNYLEEEQRTTALGYVPGCQRRLSNASKMAHVSSSCVSDRQKSTRAPAAASPRPRALPRDGGRCAALRRAACGRARRPPAAANTPPPKKKNGKSAGRFHGGPASGGGWHLCAGLPVPNTPPTASRPDGALLASTRGAGRTRGRAAASGNVQPRVAMCPSSTPRRSRAFQGLCLGPHVSEAGHAAH